MEEMGMTDAQWKDNLRLQLEQWESMLELLEDSEDSDIKAKMLKICERNISRINAGLQD